MTGEVVTTEGVVDTYIGADAGAAITTGEGVASATTGSVFSMHAADAEIPKILFTAQSTLEANELMKPGMKDLIDSNEKAWIVVFPTICIPLAVLKTTDELLSLAVPMKDATEMFGVIEKAAIINIVSTKNRF